MTTSEGGTTQLRRVSITGLHGALDLDVQLSSGLNVLYGRNGNGKTTFLHFLANLSEGELERFAHIRFKRVVVETFGGDLISLERVRRNDGTVIVLSLGAEPLASCVSGQPTPPAIRALLREKLGGRPVYLPAFRTILEAVSRHRQERYVNDRSQPDLQRARDRELEELASSTSDPASPALATYWMRERADGTAFKTILCREWFGDFVPTVRFPSLAEVADELGAEYQAAELALAQQDRTGFSEVFVDVVRTVFDRPNVTVAEDTGPILQSIRRSLESLQEVAGHVPGVYNQLAGIIGEQSHPAVSAQEVIATRILKIYDEALQARTRAQQLAFKRLKTFETSVNRFIQGKRLTVDKARVPRRPIARVELEDKRLTSLSALSSGERHVLTLLFSATHMSAADGVLLIDEPELSLHVDWQRIILSELMAQAGSRQIIACTHAPEVVGDHRDQMVRLDPSKYVSPQGELFGTVPDAGTTDEQ